MRLLLVALAVVLCLSTTGCLRSLTTLTVHRDGTAHIVDTMLFSPRFLSMVSSFSSLGVDEDSTRTKTPPADPWNDSTIAADAAAFGQDVVLERWVPLATGGMRGYVATYRAGDVNTVTLDKNRSNSALDKPNTVSSEAGEYEVETDQTQHAEEQMPMDSVAAAPQTEQTEPEPDKRQPVTFTYSNGLLTIHNWVPEPQPVQPAQDGQTQADTSGQSSDEMLATLDMMSGFLRGMKVNLKVAVDGPIRSTTAQHVSGNCITIMAVDFDKLLDAWAENPSLFKGFDSMKSGDMQAMQSVMDQYPPGAMVIEFQKEVETRF
jgi:hypothetical protein